MAGSVNKVILIGHLGKDPEVRTTNSGGKIATMSLATSESWNDRTSGNRQERTEWHRVVIFNENLVGIAEKYLRKGSKVYVEGALQTRKWADAQGTERYTTEVVLQKFRGEITLLDRREGTPPATSPDDYGTQREGTAPGTASGSGGSWQSSPLDDDIPFAPNRE